MNYKQPLIVKSQQQARSTLHNHKLQTQYAHLNQFFSDDLGCFERFSVEQEQLVLDFSKHRIDQNVLNGLVDLAHAAGVS